MNWNYEFKNDINTLTIQGTYHIPSGTNGLPINQAGIVIVFTPYGYNSNLFCLQLYVPWNPSVYAPYVRLFTNNQWYGWREL